MAAPSPARKSHNSARRGCGSAPVSALQSAGMPPPESRAMLMAPRPGGVATATMSSPPRAPDAASECLVFAGDVVLLRNESRLFTTQYKTSRPETTKRTP